MTNSMILNPELEMSFSKLAIDLSADQEADDCPEKYLCPVTGAMLVDPVLVRAACSHTVSRACFQGWLAEGNKSCPCCEAPLKALYAKVNKELKNEIQTFQLHQSQMALEASFSLLNDTDGDLEDGDIRSRSSVHARKERRVALKIKPELQKEIQAHGRSELAQQEIEKECSHSTLETYNMDTSMNDESARVRSRDEECTNWEESCPNIDNIQCRSRLCAPTSPRPGLVYKVNSSRPRGNSPAPPRNRPMKRLLHAALNANSPGNNYNDTIKARPLTKPGMIAFPTTMRLPFGSSPKKSTTTNKESKK